MFIYVLCFFIFARGDYLCTGAFRYFPQLEILEPKSFSVPLLFFFLLIWLLRSSSRDFSELSVFSHSCFFPQSQLEDLCGPEEGRLVLLPLDAQTLQSLLSRLQSSYEAVVLLSHRKLCISPSLPAGSFFSCCHWRRSLSSWSLTFFRASATLIFSFSCISVTCPATGDVSYQPLSEQP